MNIDEIKRTFQFSLIGKAEEVKKKVQMFIDSGINYFILWGPSVRDVVALEVFSRDIMRSF